MKRKTIIRTLLIVCIAAVSHACDDIFEKDISGSDMVIMTPLNAQSVSGTDILFWWDYLYGASDYELQIVNPGFNNIQILSVDTIVDTNKVIISLTPGNYEWRIRACNSAYCTDFFYHTLVVTGE